MGRIGLAVRVFFGVLFQNQVAEQVRAAMCGNHARRPTEPRRSPATPARYLKGQSPGGTRR